MSVQPVEKGQTDGAINEYQEIVERAQTPNVHFLTRTWNTKLLALVMQLGGRNTCQRNLRNNCAVLSSSSPKDVYPLSKEML